MSCLAAARLAFTEMLLAGTTTCADLSPFSETVAKAAEAVAIHAQISVPVSEEVNAWTDSAQEGLERALALHDSYARTPRIGIALGLSSLAHIDRDTLVRTAMYAEEPGLAVQYCRTKARLMSPPLKQVRLQRYQAIGKCRIAGAQSAGGSRERAGR